MKKLTLTLMTVLVIFTGCDEIQKPQETSNNRISTKCGINIYCNKETNVEYLIYKSHRSSGLSVRYNLDGSIRSCK